MYQGNYTGIQVDNAVRKISQLSVMGGSGSSHSSGLVPDTPAVAGTSKFLREDGVWATPVEGSTPVSTGNFITATEAGLVPNDNTKGSANATALAAVITAGKSLLLDGDNEWYITGSNLEISYDFSIVGKGAIICSGRIFKPLQGASIIFDGIKFIGSTTVETYLISSSSKINYQINKIILTDCDFSNFTRVVELKGADIDYSTTHYGVMEFVLKDCRFTDISTSQFRFADMVFSSSFIVKNNYVEKMRYMFFDMATTNEYTNDNRTYDCDVIFDGNIVTGTVQTAGYTYYSFLVAEVNRLIYTNNVITNLIGLGAAVYDVYASSKEVVYENNIIKNVCNLPVDSGTTLYTEIFKAKSSGRKYAANNHWVFDFDECRQLVSDVAGVTYTNERFAEINKVKMFEFTHIVDVVFTNNIITVKGGDIASSTSSRPIRTMSFNANVINVDGIVSGYMLPIWNSVTQEMIVTDNIIRSSNTNNIALFGDPYAIKDATNNARLVCKGNDTSTPIECPGSVSGSDYVLSNNSYKNFPSTMSLTNFYFSGTREFEGDVFSKSGSSIKLWYLTKARIRTHCNITSADGRVTVYIKTSNFDFYIPGIKKAYKVRYEDNVLNVYDNLGAKIGEITSSYADIITSGGFKVNAKYESSTSIIIRFSSSSVGEHDIEFADSALYAYSDNNEKAVDIISTTSSLLTAKVGTYYRFDSKVSSLAIVLPAVSSTSVLRSVMLSFSTGSSPNVTISSADNKDIVFQTDYSVEADKNYEMCCRFNGIMWIVNYINYE